MLCLFFCLLLSLLTKITIMKSNNMEDVLRVLELISNEYFWNIVLLDFMLTIWMWTRHLTRNWDLNSKRGQKQEWIKKFGLMIQEKFSHSYPASHINFTLFFLSCFFLYTYYYYYLLCCWCFWRWWREVFEHLVNM